MTTEPDISANGHVTELAQIQAAYEVIQQRDGRAERRAYHWQLVAYGALGLAVVMGLITLVIVIRRTEVKAFVQTVQVDDAKRVVQLGLPQDLMSYEPQEGQWRDMLAEWVRIVRWRGTDAILARADWRWVYIHTCGQARKLLEGYEAQEKPFIVGKKLVSVDLKSVTKTPSPLSFQVLWREMTVEGALPPKTQDWTGTFTVQRYRPKKQAELLQNTLGLCVNAFDITMQP